MGYKDRLIPYQEQMNSQAQIKRDRDAKQNEAETQEQQLHLNVLSQLKIPQVFEDIKTGLWQDGDIEITQEPNNNNLPGELNSSYIRTIITLKKEWPIRKGGKYYHDESEEYVVYDDTRSVFIRAILSSHVHLNRGEYQSSTSFGLQIESNMIDSYPYKQNERIPIHIGEEPISDQLLEIVSLSIISESEALKGKFKFPIQEQIEEDSHKVF
jgi:hypothetical protein